MKVSVIVFVIAFLAHVHSGHVNAQPINDESICPRAVDYAMQFMPMTDAEQIHIGVWKLIGNEQMDDAQRLMAVVVYHSIQQVAWQVKDIKLEDTVEVAKFWETVKETIRVECKYALNKVRFPDE